ncbi:hypothetical protein Tco_0473953 [Tanacetum coccineum]
MDMFTFDIQGIKTYEEYELNNNNTRDLEDPCSDIDGFCNGEELPGMVRVGRMTYFQDHKWYDELIDGKLKEEALMHKARFKDSWGDTTPGVMKFCAWNYEANNVGPCCKEIDELVMDHMGAKDCCLIGLRKKRCGASCNEGFEVLFIVKIIKEAKIAYGSIMGRVEQLGVMKETKRYFGALVSKERLEIEGPIDPVARIKDSQLRFIKFAYDSSTDFCNALFAHSMTVTNTDSRLLPVASPLLLQFLGVSCTQREVSMVFFGRISPNSFLPSILLLVVIIVMVVIVVVVVVAIVGVVIVVGLDFLLVSVFLLVLSVFAMLAALLSIMAVVAAEVDDSLGDGISINRSVKHVVSRELQYRLIEEEDGGWICFLGGNSSSGTKKYRGSNSSNGGNTGDGVKTAGGVIGSGDEIEFSEELKELLSDEVGK